MAGKEGKVRLKVAVMVAAAETMEAAVEATAAAEEVEVAAIES